MNVLHDMGGMHGMDPIQYESNEPVFHEPWEARVFAPQPRGGGLGQMDHRCLSSRGRAHSGARISAHELL